MSVPEIRVLGERVHALEPVSRVGEILGLSRGQAFRAASLWPTIGPPGARRVVIPTLLESLGICYQVEETNGDE